MNNYFFCGYVCLTPCDSLKTLRGCGCLRAEVGLIFCYVLYSNVVPEQKYLEDQQPVSTRLITFPSTEGIFGTH